MTTAPEETLCGATLVTGNRNKLREAREICGQELASHELDLPEIQSLDLREVLQVKGEEAWRRLDRPVIVEDTGLALTGMNGFPGPLVKWMLDAVGPQGIARHAIATGDPSVAAVCGLVYRDGDREVIVKGVTQGVLVLPARGTEGFGWDPVFQPEGSDRTYGELTSAEKIEIGHRGRAWRALVATLTGRAEEPT